MSGRLAVFSITTVLMFSFPLATAAQVPPGAKVFRNVTARLQSGAEAVRVAFYSYEPGQKRIGFVLFSRSGKPLTMAEIEGSEAPPTGIYDLTGGGTPAIVLVGSVGAKSFEAKVYSFEEGQLKEIFSWSGWHFEIVRLGGRPIIAVTPTDYGTLPKLYRWKQDQFVPRDQDFPEFFNGAIRSQQDTIERSGFPAHVYARACELGATALVYGKKYSEANKLCDRALDVVQSSPGVIPSLIGGGPEVLAADRLSAAVHIRNTLNAIQVAQKQGSANLKQP